MNQDKYFLSGRLFEYLSIADANALFSIVCNFLRGWGVGEEAKGVDYHWKDVRLIKS